MKAVIDAVKSWKCIRVVICVVIGNGVLAATPKVEELRKTLVYKDMWIMRKKLSLAHFLKSCAAFNIGYFKAKNQENCRIACQAKWIA